MKNAPYSLTFPICRRRMAGFGLVELMISITIGLVVIAALVGVMISSMRNSRANDHTVELQENGRYALEHLVRELRHAGFRGYSQDKPSQISVEVTNECFEIDDSKYEKGYFVTNLGQGVWGANDPDPDHNPFAESCLKKDPSKNIEYLRGDVLVIRRVKGQPTKNLESKHLYLRSSYGSSQIFQYKEGENPPQINGQKIDNFALQVFVYYIGPGDIEDENGNKVPALHRLTLQKDEMVDEIVVNGIENLQVQFGRAKTDLTTSYYDANQIAGSSTDETSEWDDVNSVRIWLLARSAKREENYQNTDSYEMGDLTGDRAYKVNDSYRRQLFSSVVQLRN